MIQSEKQDALAEANTARPAPLAPRFIKIAAAAQYSAISRSKLYELLAARKIKSHRIGGARVVDRESLDAYISSQPS
jgi:excisionase family DNA binding protein